MALFSFGKKKKETTCCGCSKAESVKVLGAGCKTCHQQYENAKEAVRNLGLPVAVEYITDIEKVMEYGVMVMPAMVINEKVAASGNLLSTSAVEKLLRG